MNLNSKAKGLKNKVGNLLPTCMPKAKRNISKCCAIFQKDKIQHKTTVFIPGMQVWFIIRKSIIINTM